MDHLRRLMVGVVVAAGVADEDAVVGSEGVAEVDLHHCRAPHVLVKL